MCSSDLSDSSPASRYTGRPEPAKAHRQAPHAALNAMAATSQALGASSGRASAVAAREFGVVAPLSESGFTKDDVRRLHAGLPKNVLLVIDAAYAEYVSRNDYESGVELVDQLEIEIGAGLEHRAFRIEHGGACAGAFRNAGDHARLDSAHPASDGARSGVRSRLRSQPGPSEAVALRPEQLVRIRRSQRACGPGGGAGAHVEGGGADSVKSFVCVKPGVVLRVDGVHRGRPAVGRPTRHHVVLESAPSHITGASGRRLRREPGCVRQLGRRDRKSVV